MLGWPAVLAFAALSGGAGLVGVWLMWRHEAWARRHTGELITFASGLLVSGSLLHLLNRARDMTGPVSAAGWALAAFVLLYIAESHLFPHPHGRHEDELDEQAHPVAHGHGAVTMRPFGAAAVFGLGLHALLDGVAVGAGFSTSFLTGSVIVSLVVAHKLPVGIASMGVLYHGGLERALAVRYSAVVALLTPVAVVVSFAVLRDSSASLLGAVVAAAGGTFLYVGAADLLPEGQASGRKRNTVAFILGVIVMVAALALAPHDGAF